MEKVLEQARLLAEAIAEGRSAAAEIDRYLIGYTNLVTSL